MVLLPEEGPLLQELVSAGFPFRIESFPVLRKSLLSARGILELGVALPRTLVRSLRTFRELGPGLVYVSTLTMPYWLAVSRMLRVPAVCHVHEAEEGLPKALAVGLTAPLLWASRLVANSRATAEWLTHHNRRLEARTSVVVNGFEFESDYPRLRRHEDPARLVLVGRLNPRKGQDVAIETAALLVRQGKNVELELVGSPFRGYEWFEDSLRARARELGIRDRVGFSGFVSPVRDAYERADIVLVPSIIEPFGNVAVEAMGLGRPVVVSRVGGLREIVEDGVTGLFCRPNDPADLALAVNRILDDFELAREMGDRAAAVVRQRFALERFSRDFLKVIDSALTG